MSPIHRWLDPTGLRAAILFAVLAALANGVWVLLDHTIPSWDEAHYLDVTWHYQQALAGHGPINLFETVHSLDPGTARSSPWRCCPSFTC